jgi:hypothetical protein
VSFDAGAISASLTVDTAAFDRDLAKAKADVKKFEDEPHRVKISAVFDDGDLSRARKLFSDLDTAISKDAMNRLRSSPQGSVLGSLNALFSPHPVTGAPSPQQSAQQGLLGKMLNVPGDDSGGSAASGGSAGNGGTNGTSVASILENAPGNTSTTDDIRQQLEGQGPGNVDTTDRIAQQLTGTGAGNVDTTDDIKQNLEGNAPGNVTTTDTIKQNVTGTGAKNTTTTDTVREKLDPASAAKTESDSGASGSRAGTSWASMFASHLKNLLPKSATDAAESASGSSGDRSGTRFFAGFSGHLGPFFAGFVKSSGDAGKDGGNALDSGLLGGIGPGILGISTKLSGVVGLVGSALGTLPALAGIVGTGMGVAMVGGLLAEAVKGNAQLSAQFKALGGDFTSVLSKAAAPIIPVLSGVLGKVPAMIAQLQGPLTSIFKEIGPQISGVFTGLAPIIKGLLGVMSAAAPAFGPFVQAIEKLVGDILPGLATVIKATVPFVTQFAGIMASLGSNLGSVFSASAPAIKASMGILSALLGLVGDLLPVIVKLADIFATSLAPVFTDFAGVVQSLLQPLTLVGTVIASFAGAVIGDLASAFGAVAALIKALAPSLGTLAATLSGVFAVMENVGVFAVFGDALENLAVPLANLVNALVTGLAPVLPVLTGALSQLVTVAIDVLSVALGAVLTALTPVVSLLAAAAAAVVGFLQSTGLLVPVMAGLAVAFGPVASGLTAMGAGLAAFTGSGFVAAVGGMVDEVVAFAAAAEGASLAETAMVAASLALDAVSPLAWAAIAAVAVAGLVVGVIALAKGSQDLEQTLSAQDDAVGYNISGYQKLAGQLASVAGGYANVSAAQAQNVKGAGGSAVALAQQLGAQAQAAEQMAENLQSRLSGLSQGLGVSKTTIEDWASAAGISAAKFGSAGENVGLLTTQIVGFVDKNASAVTAAASLGTNIAIFGNDVFSATAQLDAFNAIWNTLVGNLLTKQTAVTQSATSFQNLQQTIKQNGAASTATAQSFQAYIAQIGSSVTSLLKGGASISSVNGYLQTQIGNLESLGPLNKSQQADLNGLIAVQNTLANSTNGLNTQQKTMISQFENSLIPDLVKLHADTPLVNTDISNLANSIIQTGSKSASTAGDRAKLITDLENAGVNAKTATSYVDGLQTSIDGLKGKVVSVGVVGSGSGTITFTENSASSATVAGRLVFAAAGGPITGPGGPTSDQVPVWASNGEFMMQAAAVDKYGLGFMEQVNALKLAAGGPVDISSVLSAPGWMGDNMASYAKSAESQAAQAALAAMKAKLAAEAAAAATLKPTGSGATVQALMKSMAASVGWTGAEWTALAAVEAREAGYSLTATNPSSGAYGLAQFIGGASEYAQYGGNSTTAAGQITAMLNYIKDRYSDPIAAEAHEVAYGWYGNGGVISEPVLGYGVNSGRGYVIGENGSEMVTPLGGKTGGDGASSTALLAKLDQLISVTRQIPAGVGDQVGGAIGGASAAASFRARFPRGGA